MNPIKYTLLGIYLLTAASVCARDHLIVSLGLNQPIGDRYSLHNYRFDQEASNPGMVFSFSIPIIESPIRIYYKSHIVYHPVVHQLPDDRRHLIIYSNEVAITGRTTLSDKVYLDTSFGAGLQARNYYSPGRGISEGYFFGDLTNSFMFQLNKMDIGFYASLFFVPFDVYFYSQKDVSVHAGLALSL
ncbi:hypothetical protein JW824_13545 [bacterium]|nr:hypothetical protein [bacterium]